MVNGYFRINVPVNARPSLEECKAYGKSDYLMLFTFFSRGKGWTSNFWHWPWGLLFMAPTCFWSSLLSITNLPNFESYNFWNRDKERHMISIGAGLILFAAAVIKYFCKVLKTRTYVFFCFFCNSVYRKFKSTPNSLCCTHVCWTSLLATDALRSDTVLPILVFHSYCCTSWKHFLTGMQMKTEVTLSQLHLKCVETLLSDESIS